MKVYTICVYKLSVSFCKTCLPNLSNPLSSSCFIFLAAHNVTTSYRREEGDERERNEWNRI